MKKVFIICAFLAHSYLFAQKTGVTGKETPADIYWKTKPVKKDIQVNWSDSPSIKIAANVYEEMYSRELRSWGMEFWKKFPGDPRRFEWFTETTRWGNEPFYFMDIFEGAIARSQNRPGMFRKDIQMKKQWMDFYNAHRDEYLASLSKEYRKGYLREEIGNKTYYCLWATEGEKFDFVSFGNKFRHYATNYLTEPSQIATQVDMWINLPQAFDYPVKHKNGLGLTDADVFKYIDLIKSGNNPAVQKVASQLEQRMLVQLNSIGLPQKDHEGNDFDINRYKGKIVLVDFWSLGCSDCIAKMPEIKSVYEKYKNDGFEVISACFYGGKPEQVAKIRGVHKKIGADWPLLLLDGNEGKAGQLINDKFGFTGVPQLFLLDGNGNRLQYNDQLKEEGYLEQFVKGYLGATAGVRK